MLLAEQCEIRYEYGGYAIRGSLADAVAKSSPAIAALSLILAALVAGRALRRSGESERIALVASACVLVWLVFILTSKVGSPQYLLWLAPLVPLMPLRSAWDFRAAIGFVVACVVTTLTYPYLWTSVHGPNLPDRTDLWAGPNVLGFALLLCAGSFSCAFAVWVFVRLATPTITGDPRHPCPAS